ncbi:MAG: hypothetical protein KAX15_00020, partial [Candidatus Omnitrophica bacterium]|nr:hypothetical protein [Candidatus Omnitrophota bacterium]
MRVLFLIICIAVVLLSVAPGESAAEETSYTIIVSNSTKSAVKNLQSSISNMMGENVSHRKIEHHSPEAKEWIDLLEIKFVPYVIFSENIKKYEKFFSLLNNKAIISKNGQYVIPDKMLRPLGIMFLNRPIKSHQLDVFLMSKCPIGNSALQQLNNYLTANPNKFNINIHYIADFNEFGINSVRGAKEIKEDIRQLLVQKYYPDKFWQYHRLYLQKERYEAIFKKIAIDAAIIDSHKEDGLKLLKKDFNLYNELGIIYSINSSPTFLWENQVLLSSIRQVYEIIMPESNS